jgi:putative ABC transport system substrate-binding protein
MGRARRALALSGALILGLLAAPLDALAQSARVYHVGVVLLGGPYSTAVDGLREGLRELGFEEGKQFVLQVRDGKSDFKLVEAAARSFEGAGVDLIYAVGSSVAVTVKRSTKSVPIVFHSGVDPVSIGLVENFRKPGGRLTGLHSQSRDLMPKRLELLKEMVPTLRRVVTFYNPDSPAGRAIETARHAAHELKLELVERRVASVEQLRASLRALRPGEADAIFYAGDALVSSQAQLVIETAKAKKLPTMLQEEASVAMGALASYGVSYHTIGRLSAKQVHRILLGARPGDLPVEQLDRLHFAINLKTAKAIGLTIPPAVLALADEVIQ